MNLNFVFAEYPEIHAVIGSTISLPCNLSPPSNDDVISLVLWYRLDLPNPIYTLDARSAQSADMAKHFSSKVLGSSLFQCQSTQPGSFED
ncbi:ig-like domain-containing protein [Caerostris extrusa]|uniref:Ig-like domain-containing protein n=1 Tax=Caerostris extrusa TaxID=172846 RepID=A0AAV4QEG9_CAEEX|nr:ig-like domain-containing protein [Caerostris extrusa]